MNKTINKRCDYYYARRNVRRKSAALDPCNEKSYERRILQRLQFTARQNYYVSLECIVREHKKKGNAKFA